MQIRPASMTTSDKLDPSLTGRIRISTVICYASNITSTSKKHVPVRVYDRFGRQDGGASAQNFSDSPGKPIPDRDVVPDRCNSSESAMDACSDTPAWARRAERAADGSVVDGPRALSGSPRAPRIHAQGDAQFDPYNTCNCLPPMKLHREIQ